MSEPSQNDAAVDYAALRPIFEQVAADLLARQPSVLEALRALCDLAEVNHAIPAADYHVLVVPDVGDLIDRSFSTAQAAADFLKTGAGPGDHVRVYYGRRCLTTRPPAPYLLTHEGRFPLFAAETSADVDLDGLLVPCRPTPSAPPATEPIDDSPEDEEDDAEDEAEDEDDNG